MFLYIFIVNWYSKVDQMHYVTEQILESLRESRISKGLSQRELSVRSGVPQSHISKIESGGVDLRISSLIALARVLDLELFVAPKKSVPAIKSIIRSSKGRTSIGSYDEGEQRSPAYRLDEDIHLNESHLKKSHLKGDNND